MLQLNQQVVFSGRYIQFDVKGQGEPLVIIHGTPWSSFNMRHIIEALSRHFTVYYYDLLGFGQSDKRNADVSFSSQLEVLKRLLSHWELKTPNVIAHDIGGTIALGAATLGQQTFKRISVINPVLLQPWGSPFYAHVAKWEKAFSNMPGFAHKALLEAYILSAATDKTQISYLPMTMQPWLGQEGQQAFYRQIAQADKFFTETVAAMLPKLNIKTQILWGEEDAWLPVEQAYVLKNLLPQADLKIFEGTGHLIIEEKSTELVDALKNYHLLM